MQFLKKKKYRRIAGILFLAFSASWLFGPSIIHSLTAGPNLISEYESVGLRYSFIFKIFDGLAAVIFLLSVQANKARIKKRWGRWVPLVLTIIAALMALDIVLPLRCTVEQGICMPHSGIISVLHGIETYSIAVLTLCLSSYVVIKFRRGSWFIAVQIICFVAGIYAHSYNDHRLFAIQAAYQILQAFWLYQLVFVDELEAPLPERARYLRYLIATWVSLNGVIAILSTLHRLELGRIEGLANTLIFTTNPGWQLSRAILIGLLLMYFGRQLWQGDRRAAMLTSLLLLAQLLIVSTMRHGWFYIIVFGLPLLALVYYHDVFDKRGNFVGFTSRLRFIAAGVIAIAICMTLILVVVRAGHHGDWRRTPLDVGKVVRRTVLLQTDIEPYASVRDRILDTVTLVLGASVYAWVLIGIFLPESSFHNQSHAGREELLEALKRHSNSSEDYFKYWPEDKFYYRSKAGSMIAYTQAGTVIIALADPVGEARNRKADIKEFTDYCRGLGYKSAWLLVNEDSKKAYDAAGRKLLQIGSAAEVDIAEFTNKTIRNKWWRWQMNRAEREGYRYEVHTAPHSPRLLKATSNVSEEWMQRDGHREQTFAMGYFNENYLQECRLHCLYDKKGKLIAFTNEVPIFGQKQTTVDLIRFIPEHDGSMQTLLAHAIRQLAEEETYQSFDLGFVPMAQVDSMAAKIMKQFSGRRFSSAGLLQFKNKFDPKWQPYYLAYDGDVLDLPKIFMGLDRALGVKVAVKETPEN